MLLALGKPEPTAATPAHNAAQIACRLALNIPDNGAT